MPTVAAAPKVDCPPAMKVPDCIQCVCRDYRKLFATDESMAEALGLELSVAQGMLAGNVYPNLEVMVLVQDALRKASVARPVRR
jgi:hypothetical protein